MIVRRAILQDVRRICEIISQMTPGLPHDYRQVEKKFEYIASNNDYYLSVAEIIENERFKVVGTSMIHLQHKLSYNCGLAGHLEDLVVDKEYRGRGIGEMLVMDAINFAKYRGCYKLILGCFEKTVPFYKKFGFEVHDIGMRINFKELYPKV